MLTSDARAVLEAEAFATGCTIPATSRRHVRLDDPPTVLVPLSLAGEDGALLAFATSHDRGDLTLHVCPEPRDRTLAHETLLELSRWLCGQLDPLIADREDACVRSGWTQRIARRSLQIVVPTPAGATLLRRLGERMVWSGRRADPLLVRAGGWLLFFCDRHEVVPGDSSLVVLTDALLAHFVPPISSAEGAHLLALVEALSPPPGQSPADAAASVEAEAGGTLTTPTFDRDELEPAIEAFNRARRTGSRSAADACRDAIAKKLRPVVERLSEAVHRGLEQLRTLPPIPEVDGRRAVAERLAFTRHADYLARSGVFRRADSLRRGLLLVDDAEAELGRVSLEARLSDPVVCAVASLTGEAISGTLESAQAVRVAGNKRAVQRVQLTVRVRGEWRPASPCFACVGPDGLYSFDVIDVSPIDSDTCVVMSSSDRQRDARSVLLPSLSSGQPIRLAACQDEFPSMRVPETPWMLTAGGP